MSTLRKIQDLQSRLERAKQAKIRNEVTRDNALADLKEKFDVDSLEDAKEFLRRYESRRDKRKARLEEAVDRFEELYGDKL